VTLMGGVIKGSGNVDDVPGVEWNLHADPQAAAAVIASGLHITVVTLDATNDVPVEQSYLERARHAAAGKDAAWAAQRMTELAGLSFWDPLAAAALIDPALIRTRTATVTVDASSGALDEAAGGTTFLVAESADRDAFEWDLLAALAAKPTTTRD
jgi:purine nucleosidase